MPVLHDVFYNEYRNLWWGVFTRAMQDLECKDYKSAAEEWLNSDSTEIGSAKWILEICDIEEGSYFR